MTQKIPPSEALKQEISKLMREGLEMACHSASGGTPKIFRELDRIRAEMHPLKAVA